MPPGMISRTAGTSTSSMAIFSALVITLIDLQFELADRLAISAVVVPESRIMVSPSWMSATAALAIRTFSA